MYSAYAQASVQADQGTLTVRAPVAQLNALNQTFADLLDGKSEVLLEVKIYQVENTRTRLVGVQPPQSTTLFNVPSELNNVIANNSSLVQQIIASGLASAGDYAAIAAILIASGEVSSSILNQPFATFGKGLTLTGLAPGSATGNLSLNAADTRALDEVQLRLDDNAEGDHSQRHALSHHHLELLEHCVFFGQHSRHHQRRALECPQRPGHQREQPLQCSAPFPRCSIRTSA